MASVRLRTEPTVHQVDVILACVEGSLDRRSARVRRGTRGEVRFRMPPPWQAEGAGMLRLVTSGEVNVIAGWGEPRRLHYDLSFVTLYALGVLLSTILVVTGWDGPRLELLRNVLVLWAGVLLLRLIVARSVRHLLAACARDIVERRAEDRTDGETARRSGEKEET